MPSPSGQTPHRPRPRAVLGLCGLALLTGMLLGGCSTANAGDPSHAGATGSASGATSPSSSSAATTGAAPIPMDARGSAPGTAAGASGSAASGAGSLSAGSGVASIAYPYPGTSGIAPDHTIVVVGTGRASLASGASDAARRTAEHGALSEALADARSQADAIAAALHVTIDGVLSVSASQSPYTVYPMGMAALAPTAPAPTGTAPGTLSPGPMPPAIAPSPGPSEIAASVTVAYTIH